MKKKEHVDMSDANFKKDLNEKLANYDSPIDLDAEWAALEAIRSPKRKRRFFFWRWLGLGLVLVSAGLIYSYSFDKKSTVTTANHQEIIQKNISTKTSEESQNVVAIKEEKELLQSEQEVSQKTIPKSIPEPLAYSKKMDVQHGQQIPKTVFLKEKTSPIKHTNALKTNTISSADLIKNQNQAQLNQQISDSNLAAQKVNTLRTLSLQTSFIEIPEPVFDWPLEEVIIKKIKVKRRPWNIGLSAGYGKAFRALHSSQGNTQEYVNRRNAAENILDTWYASLHTRKYFTEHWFVEAGLSYAQTTTRFQDINILVTSGVLDDQLVRLTYRTDGSIEEIYGSLDVETITTTRGTYYQYNKNVGLQLLGGRSFSINKKMGIHLSAGINYSISSKKEGTVFSSMPDNDYDDLRNTNFRKSGLVRGIAQAEFYFRPSKNWELALGILGNSQLNNAFLDDNLSEKEQLLATQIGIRRSF